MKFTIDPMIFQKFPNVTLGVIVMDAVHNEGESAQILKLLRTEEARQRLQLQGLEIGLLPEVSAWRRIYKAFGADPHDYRSSVEALLRRAKSGAKPLPQINKLVDLYNYLSIKYHLPFGAEDLDAIQGNMKLCFCVGTESGRALGTESAETCLPGEIAYTDDEGFICRRWNWREADRTKITTGTTRAIMVIERVSEVSIEQFHAAIDESCVLVSKELQANARAYVMHTDLVSVTIS